jgi:hypothetical protein
MARNIECNKRMLRELFLEAESMAINDDGNGDEDSNASSSSDSEDEKLAETERIKKALEELQSTLDNKSITHACSGAHHETFSQALGSCSHNSEQNFSSYKSRKKRPKAGQSAT